VGGAAVSAAVLLLAALAGLQEPGPADPGFVPGDAAALLRWSRERLADPPGVRRSLTLAWAWLQAGAVEDARAALEALAPEDDPGLWPEVLRLRAECLARRPATLDAARDHYRAWLALPASAGHAARPSVEEHLAWVEARLRHRETVARATERAAFLPLAGLLLLGAAWGGLRRRLC